jgi:hypothetical protein
MLDACPCCGNMDLWPRMPAQRQHRTPGPSVALAPTMCIARQRAARVPTLPSSLLLVDTNWRVARCLGGQPRLPFFILAGIWTCGPARQRSASCHYRCMGGQLRLPLVCFAGIWTCGLARRRACCRGRHDCLAALHSAASATRAFEDDADRARPVPQHPATPTGTPTMCSHKAAAAHYDK